MENGHTKGSLIADELPSGEEIAWRFNFLLDRFPRADGEPWRGAEIEAASGRRVTSAYISALRKGKFQSPGIAHLRSISETMGFPFELWYVDPGEWDHVPGGRPPEPLDETLALDPQERAMVQLMRSMDDQKKDAVVAVVRQMAAL